MDLPLAPSYAVLCLVQGLLVLAPWKPYAHPLPCGRPAHPRSRDGGRVGIVRGFSDGADALTMLATVATPAFAAIAGWARRWPLPWLPLVLTPVLYVIAWQYPDTLGGDAAGLALIGGACLTLAALIAALTPPWALAVGLVVVVAVDVLRLGHRPGRAGDDRRPPGGSALGRGDSRGSPKPLPALQDGTFGSALMGWLDFLAPALLGTLFVGRVRVQVAVATTLAALAWGLLLLVTDPVAATVPVLAGLAVGGRALRADSG